MNKVAQSRSEQSDKMFDKTYKVIDFSFDV